MKVLFKKLRYFVMSFGCQMSENDGGKIAGILENLGYEKTDSQDEADIIVFNTCCVREHAEEKIFSKLGQCKVLKMNKPDLIIAFGGCMAQQKHIVEKIEKSYKFVDIVFGTHNLHRLPELINRSKAIQDIVVEVFDIDGEVVEGVPIKRNDKLKASVSIMYGCNNFCTYCIVPYVRGRERSRKPIDIIDEVKGLVSEGYKEITLLGQNVNSYGKDIDGGYNFSRLLREINNIDGEFIIRFMTSHPKDMTDELIDVIQECEKVCEQVHLPFQSGSSRLLEKMNRKYTKEHYLGLIDKLKNKIPNIGLSADVIVGFPGETEEDFLDTVDVIRKVCYDQVFTFIYSKRNGTPASNMDNQIDEDVKKDRMSRLLSVHQEVLKIHNDSLIGNSETVLVEGVSRNIQGCVSGRTRTARVVNFKGDESLVGRFVKVRITENHLWYFVGELEG